MEYILGNTSIQDKWKILWVEQSYDLLIMIKTIKYVDKTMNKKSKKKNKNKNIQIIHKIKYIHIKPQIHKNMYIKKSHSHLLTVLLPMFLTLQLRTVVLPSRAVTFEDSW